MLEPTSESPQCPGPRVAEVLQRATAELYYVSETDAPLEVIEWDDTAISPELLIEKSGRPLGTSVQRLDVGAFFAPATREADWHGPRERERATRFRALVATLERVLTGVEAWRVGGVEADVYILGRTAGGSIAGIKTRVVQT